jgi:predicted TIM-barrel fold metal-dependent hydrolase
MRPELAQFADEVRALTPPDAEILDAHTHLGVDEDDHRLDPPTLLRQMDRVGIGQACVFALHDPERTPAFRVPNDRVLAWAHESDGRFIPFCRLDPTDDAVAEANRCLAQGARGIKLHPRAQAFAFDTSAIAAVFAVAQDAGIPILIHAGRGLGPIADALCDVALAHPGAPLVLAHAGMADQGIFATRLADHPGAFFDTSAFGPLDVLDLFARVPVERIVFGSDPPYGRPLLGLYLTLRCAAAAGIAADDVRGLLGGTMRTVLAGNTPRRSTTPRGDRSVLMNTALTRLSLSCGAAFTAIVQRQPKAAGEHIALALSVCRDPDPGPTQPALARLEPALSAAARALETPGARAPADLVYLAMTLAATEPGA